MGTVIGVLLAGVGATSARWSVNVYGLRWAVPSEPTDISTNKIKSLSGDTGICSSLELFYDPIYYMFTGASSNSMHQGAIPSGIPSLHAISKLEAMSIARC